MESICTNMVEKHNSISAFSIMLSKFVNYSKIMHTFIMHESTSVDLIIVLTHEHTHVDTYMYTHPLIFTSGVVFSNSVFHFLSPSPIQLKLQDASVFCLHSKQ